MPLTLALDAIDAGVFRPVPGDEIPSVQESWIAEAERAAYLARETDALDAIARAGELPPELGRRALLIRAELAVGRGDAADGRRLATTALVESLEAGDRKLELRARLAITRATVRAGLYREALADLPALRSRLEADGSAFWVAIADHLEAYCRLKCDDPFGAVQCWNVAIGAFAEIGAGRWEGLARNGLGLALSDLGDGSAAVVEFETAELIAGRLSIPQDMLVARVNIAREKYAAGCFADGLRAMQDTLSWTETGSLGRTMAQLLVAFGLSMTGQKTEACAAAELAAEHAEALGSEEYSLYGRLLCAWTRGSADQMRPLLERARSGSSPTQLYAALLYSADLTPGDLVDVSAALLEEARQTRTWARSEWTTLEARIAERLDRGRIRIENETVFVVDTSDGVPEFDEAVAALRRFLVRRALAIAGGNQNRAADLLDVAASTVHDWKCKAAGMPTRPHGKASPARRQRSRKNQRERVHPHEDGREG